MHILLITFLSLSAAAIKAQDHDALLLQQRTDIEVRNGILKKSESFEIQINNRTGEKFTKLSIPYSRLNKVKITEACLKDLYGNTIRKLKKSEVTDRSRFSDNTLYEDQMVMEFTLKHNVYPYILACSFEYRVGEYFYLDYWSPVLDYDIPTQFAELNVFVPADYSILYSCHNTDQPMVDSLEGRITYRWQAAYSGDLEEEVQSPPLFDFLPSVFVVPEHFTYGVPGSCNSWKNFGNWVYDLSKGLNDLPPGEKQKISGLVRGIEDDKEKIRVLYHYLQDATRYINVSIETGGFKPYPSSYVAENKYGDCKALTNYFQSVLDYAGIKSYYTLVNAGSLINHVDTGFPSSQFNHAFLFVPTENDSIWLDCTSDRAFNYLGTSTQNRFALVIDKDSSHLVRTPSLNVPDVMASRMIHVSSRPDGRADVSYRNEYRGRMYEILADYDHYYTESEKSVKLTKRFGRNGVDPSEFRINLAHRDSTRIGMSYSALADHIYNQYGDEILIENIAFTFPRFEKPADRKLPVQIDYPSFETDTLFYEISPGFELAQTIGTHDVMTKYGKYRIEFNNLGNSVRVVKSMTVFTGNYPVSEYRDFYDFFKLIIEIERGTIITLKKSR